MVGNTSDRWVPIAEAASILNVRERTVERRIAQDKLEHRKIDGRVEVLITDVGHRSDASSDAVAAVADAGERQIQLAGASIGMADRLARAYETESDRARQDVRRTRRVAVLAWIFVGLMSGALVGAAWFAATQQGHAELAQQAIEQQKQRGDNLAGLLSGAMSDKERVQAQLEQQIQRGDALAERLTQQAAEGAVLAAQLDRAMMDLAAAEADKAAQMASDAFRFKGGPGMVAAPGPQDATDGTVLARPDDGAVRVEAVEEVPGG